MSYPLKEQRCRLDTILIRACIAPQQNAWHKNGALYRVNGTMLLTNRPDLEIEMADNRIIPQKYSNNTGYKTTKSQRIELLARYQTDRDFWRGVIDGDGCLAFSTDGYPLLSLVGSEELMTQFRDFVRTFIPSYTAKIGQNKGAFRIHASGKGAAHITSVLYNGATIFLDRKMEKARLIMEHTPSPPAIRCSSTARCR